MASKSITAKNNYMESFQDQMHRLFGRPSMEPLHLRGSHVYDITIQVTEACNLCCTYCYQHDKSPAVLDVEVGKKFIDMILASDERSEQYIQSRECEGVILNFIGGDPLLEIDMVDELTDYFIQRMIELEHPWSTRFRIGIGTNGLLYFDPKVQNYLKKNYGHVSVSITVDGNKKLHDSCRIDHNGDGSYDRAMAAVKDWQKRIGDIDLGTKITIAPGNLDMLSEALIEFSTGTTPLINCNCVYEEGWTSEHATKLYTELKKVADYLIEHDLQDTAWISILDQACGTKHQGNQTWCGGNGLMMALDVRGNIYPCIRYTPSSIGGKQPDYIIGTAEHGFGQTPEEAQRIKCLSCINRETQCSQECLDCPISMGCGDCAGYSYEVTGKIGSRVTYICEMHKARVLACVYYSNKAYLKSGKKTPRPLLVPKEWAIPIIGKEEYDLLVALTEQNAEATKKYDPFRFEN